MQPWSRAPGLAAQAGSEAAKKAQYNVVTQASALGIDKPMGDLTSDQKAVAALAVIS